jgi:uroporphyrinogen decarboxylase
MNARERFLAAMSFDPCDRALLWEFGYWAGTLRRWYDEGLGRHHGIREELVAGDSISGEAMPCAETLDGELRKLFPTKDIRDLDVHDSLGLDAGFVMLPINTSFCPAFTPGIIEEREETRLVKDGFGVIKEVRKDAGSIPRFVKWPMEDRNDFEQLKERLQPGLSKRVPQNWEELVARYQRCDFPLIAGFCGEGFFGNLRRLMGEVRLFTAYYDEPELIHDMNDYFATLWISLWENRDRPEWR